MATNSAADRLAAAKSQLESAFASHHSPALLTRDSSAAERLAAAKSQLEASLGGSLNGFTKRSLSALDRLTAAKGQFEASHTSGHSKRDLSALDRLTAAKSQFEVAHSHTPRDLSALDRLSAAKAQLEESYSLTHGLIKRADNETTEGNPEMPVSNFQKTVMPIIIGLVYVTMRHGYVHQLIHLVSS
jgi:hypothetical protein